jgi:hypothetical protein
MMQYVQAHSLILINCIASKYRQKINIKKYKHFILFLFIAN